MIEKFQTITMRSRTGRTLFLDITTGSPKWTLRQSEACYWDTAEEAEGFGERYFKNFSDWKVEEIQVEI